MNSNSCQSNGLNMHEVDQLFHFRSQLDIAKEIILALEQERTIYRSFFSKCKCHHDQSLATRNKIKEIDDKIQSFYSQCDLFTTPNDLSLPVRGNSVLPFNSTNKLGIDIKTFLGRQHVPNGSVSSWKKRKFRCSVDKCRFKSLSEKSLIKHKLQHRRQQLLAIIEPHGFTMTADNSKILFKGLADGQQLIKQCCFPSCCYQFPLANNSADFHIEHFEKSHLPTYILYPCFNCLLMFDTNQKLQNHIDSQLDCKYNRQKYATDPFEPSQAALLSCKLCPDGPTYQNKLLFDLHTSLIHSQTVSNLSNRDDQPDFPCTSNTSCLPLTRSDSDNSIYSKLSKHSNFSADQSDFSNEKSLSPLKLNHAKQVDNLDDQLIDLIYYPSDSDEQTFDTDMKNIALEVFIENNNNNDNSSQNLSSENAFSIYSDCDRNDTELSQLDYSNDTLCRVFNDDHTYNIEPQRVKPEPVESEKQAFMQMTDDHEDYTKNLDKCSLIEELSDVQVSTETRIIDSDSGNCPSDLVRFDSTVLFEHSYSDEFVMMDVESVSQMLKNEELVKPNDNVEVVSQTPDNPLADSMKNDDSNQLKQLMNLYIYECPMCTYSFRSEQELSVHIYHVHNFPSYHCSECDYVTQDTGKYHCHEMLHKKKDQSQPDAASIRTLSAQTNLESNPLVCTICSDSFESKIDLNRHINQNHKQFRCEICQVTMANRLILSSHMISFHRDAFMKCDFCNYKTFSQSNFESHRRKHTDYKKCPDCSDSFPNDDILEAHINKFHKIIKPYQCKECDSKFHSQKNLNKHLVMEHHHFLYNCDQCGFKNNNKSNLLVHLKKHSSEKPFECSEPGCFSRFRTRHLLLSHLKHKHSQEKNFKCEQPGCGRVFKTKPQLKQHNKVHQSEIVDVSDGPSTVDLKPSIRYFIFGPETQIEGLVKNDEMGDNFSLMIKPNSSPSSLDDSSSAPILTTTITPVDDIDQYDVDSTT